MSNILIVEPMSRSTNHLLNFYGSNSETYTLIAKAIIRGAYDYEQFEELTKYKPGTVLASRAEAICIQQQLRQCVKSSNEYSARIASKRMLASDTLPTLLENGGSNESQILEDILTRLGDERQKQQNGLITFGEEFSTNKPNQILYGIQEEVDITDLKERKASTNLKILYREFNRIKDMTQRL